MASSLGLVLVLAAGFVAAVGAPLLHRHPSRPLWRWLPLVPGGLVLWFLGQWPAVTSGRAITADLPWAPSLGLALTLRLDGLGLLFCLLVSGLGLLVLLYAGRYLEGHPTLAQFHVAVLAFMAAMLGVVCADNVLALFLFWELTSITSYILIGFDHEEEEARAVALQALLVTGAGGLAMLAGLLLMASAADSWSISGMIAAGDAVRESGWYPLALVLVLLGCFTKSAQFPFHFWLPGAMAAPTPISAYLHSATMVKAGVYLLARLLPVLGGTIWWTSLVASVGAVTLLVGATVAWPQSYLKRLLAYSTVAILGLITLLLGIGTAAAVKAALLVIFAHALYKGALFLIAGILDHETGEKSVDKLGGLAARLPITSVATTLAGLSALGIFPLLGFIAKEYAYEAGLASPWQAGWLTAAMVVGSAVVGAVMLVFCLRPFVGPLRATRRDPHEAPWELWLGPLLLGALGLLVGPGIGLLNPLISAASEAVAGVPAQAKVWHGVGPALYLSLLTLLLAGFGYLVRDRVRDAEPSLARVFGRGPAWFYGSSLEALRRFASWLADHLQTGQLTTYVRIVLVVAVGLISVPWFGAIELPGDMPLLSAPVHEVATVLVILAGALTAALTHSRVAAVASLGAVGYGMALLFVFYGAPDLAMTQFLVDTLAVVLFVLALRRLPRMEWRSSLPARLRDGALALAVGGLMTMLVLAALATPHSPELANYFAREAYPGGHGRNIVNVILVDFRALDTLGEITVLAIAALGVFSLLRRVWRPA